MSRFLQAVVTLTWLTSSFTICDSCAVVGGDEETGVNCTFKNDICTWENADGNNINWTRNNGNNFWNVPTKTKQSFQGKYMSTTICSTENCVYSLRFRYKIKNSICKLSVKLQSIHAVQTLWSRNETTPWVPIETPVNISSPDVEFKIVFLAEKIYTESKMKCFIRIDDIVYEYTGIDIPWSELVSTLSTAAASQTSTKTATAAEKETTHVSIQSTEKDVDDTTTEKTPRNTSETMEENATDKADLLNKGASSGDSDPGLGIGIGVALFVVVVAVAVFVVVVRYRRRKQNDEKVTCLRMPPCLQRERKPRLPQAERLRPAVHNSAYSSEDDQIILNGRRVSGCKGDDHAYELAKTQENTDYCNLSTAVLTTASVSANATRLENTYFELEAEPSAGGNTHPGESLYEVTDRTEFEDHYSVPDDAQPVLGRGTVQSGDNSGYELATLPKTDIYCSPQNTDATKHPGTGNHTSSVHNQTTGVKADEYNKLSRQNPRTDVRRNDDYNHLKPGGDLKPSQTGTAQYSMAQLQDEYNHLNKGEELKPGQIGTAEDEYNHLTQEQDRQKPAQLATSEYCVANPTESGVTDRHTKERATNYVNVSLADNTQEEEYNRLDFEKNASSPAAGKGSGGGAEGGEYNHLKAESCQNQDDEYNNLNFRRSDPPSEKGQGSDVYNRLSNDRT